MDQSGSRPVANELLWSFLMPELNLIAEAEEKKMEKRDYDKEIQELTKAAEEYVETVKDQIAALADEGGVQAYWGNMEKMDKHITLKVQILKNTT